MNKGKIAVILFLLGSSIGFGIMLGHSEELKTDEIEAKPALSVNVIQPIQLDIPLDITANGSIAAWHEAIIGAEASDLKLTEVSAEVGEKVRKGQVLAIFSDESVLADVAQSRAVLAEAEANLNEARLNAARAGQVADSGALSNQQIEQYFTSEKTMLAKMQLAKAQLDSQLLRLKYTRVLASDDGIISSRSATIGAVSTKGQELFRLIRQNRLEWRGEVTAAEINQLKPGLPVTVTIPNLGSSIGTIRQLGASLDVQTRNALVYVDLPGAASKGIRAGMFAKGDFHLGVKPGLTVPLEAISLREGFSYVFRLGDSIKDTARVTQIKVQTGRRSGDNLEIISGTKSEDRIVASGATFLTDGDSVKVITP